MEQIGYPCSAQFGPRGGVWRRVFWKQASGTRKEERWEAGKSQPLDHRRQRLVGFLWSDPKEHGAMEMVAAAMRRHAGVVEVQEVLNCVSF